MATKVLAMPLRRFTLGGRITVVRPTSAAASLMGRTGRVVRLRRADSAAWVEMDDDLPPEMVIFAAGDDRHRHTLLWPDECAASDSPPSRSGGAA